jgi:hypothetical protein
LLYHLPSSIKPIKRDHVLLVGEVWDGVKVGPRFALSSAFFDKADQT